MSTVTSAQPFCIDASSLRSFIAPVSNPRSVGTRSIRLCDQRSSPAASTSAKVQSARSRLWSLSSDQAALDAALDAMINSIIG